jgi:carotenoid cleavage dioxygenase-like enzyme
MISTPRQEKGGSSNAGYRPAQGHDRGKPGATAAAELDTIGPCDFGGTLPGGFAAHTKPDRRTGELHAVAYFWAADT